MNKHPKPLKLDQKVVFRQLTDDGTFATPLHIICLDTYGEDIYTIDPLELLLRLQEDFGADVTNNNEERIKAILLAVSTDIFFEEPEGFRGICETLNNGDPGIEIMDSLTVPEIAWGLYEVELNHGPGDFRQEVLRLIDQVVQSEGLDPDEASSEDYSYVRNYVSDCHRMLTSQLIELGISPSDIPSADTPTLPGILEVDQVQ